MLQLNILLCLSREGNFKLMLQCNGNETAKHKADVFPKKKKKKKKRQEESGVPKTKKVKLNVKSVISNITMYSYSSWHTLL